jgi:hypothetical protein
MKKKEALYFSLFALFTIISFYPVFFSGKIVTWLDMTFYFLPFREMTSHLIRANIMPFWNPYIYGGNPLLANMQSAVFYPLNIFFHLFTFATAFKFYIFFSYFLMASFMYKFLESCGITKDGAFAGAVIFAFGFYTVIKAPEMAELSTLVWLPAALYFINKYSVSRRTADLCLTAFALSLSLLGGHPQFFVYCWLIFTFFYAYEFLVKTKTGFAVAARDFLVIHLIFAAVTAVQWVPTLRFLMNSKRLTQGFELAQIMGSYMNYTQLLSFFCPVFGMALPERDNFMNWAGKIDIGIAALMLLPLGIATFKDKRLRTLLLLAFTVVLFLAYLGSMPFFIPLYEHFRFISVIRYPSRIIVAGYFIICFFAASGFDALFSRPAAEIKKYALFVAAVFIFFAGIYFAALYNKKLFIGIGVNIFSAGRSFQDVYDRVEQYAYIMNDFFLFVLLCGGSAALFALAAIDRYRGAFVKYSSLALIAAGALLFNKTGYDSFGDLEWNKQETRQTSFLERTAADGNVRVLAPNVTNPFDFAPDLDGLRQWTYYASDSLTPNTPMTYGIYNSDGFDSLFLSRYHEFTSGLMLNKTPWRSRAFALLSAKYIASAAVIKDSSLKVASKGYCILYETDNFLKRAFFMDGNADVARLSVEQGSRLMLDPGFDPAKTLILDAPAPLMKIPAAVQPGKKADVRIIPAVDTNTIEVAVNDPSPGWLVVTDNYYPGWKVFVDSVEKPLLKAYTTFKAVYLESGAHRVVFKYSPPELPAAAVISFGTLLAAALALIYYCLRMKRKNP